MCLCAIDVICLCLCVRIPAPPHLLAEQGNGHAADLEMENDGCKIHANRHRNQPKILMKMKYYTWANLSLLRTAHLNVMNKGMYIPEASNDLWLYYSVLIARWPTDASVGCLQLNNTSLCDNHNMSKQLPENKQIIMEVEVTSLGFTQIHDCQQLICWFLHPWQCNKE